jgi:thiol-disulfide isomerase/thioredoxin
METKTTLIVIALTLVVAGGFIGYEQYKVSKLAAEEEAAMNAPSIYLPLAQCLKEKQVVFYGAEWCPHCKEQKKAFGSAVKALPYVECAVKDASGGYTPELAQVCIDAKIEGFPTWVFPDGSRQSGEVPMKTLAEKSGCALPQEPAQ